MRQAVLALAITLAACGLIPPSPECDPGSSDQQAALTCEAAVAAAASKLPEDHPWIERIQFLYGSAIPCCSRLSLPEEDAPIAGYVVFTYVTGSREYVDVSLWRDTLHVGEPLPYGEPD